MLSIEAMMKAHQELQAQGEQLDLRFRKAMADHTLALNTQDGTAESRARQDLHTLIDLRLDLIAALEYLRKKISC